MGEELDDVMKSLEKSLEILKEKPAPAPAPTPTPAPAPTPTPTPAPAVEASKVKREPRANKPPPARPAKELAQIEVRLGELGKKIDLVLEAKSEGGEVTFDISEIKEKLAKTLTETNTELKDLIIKTLQEQREINESQINAMQKTIKNLAGAIIPTDAEIEAAVIEAHLLRWFERGGSFYPRSIGLQTGEIIAQNLNKFWNYAQIKKVQETMLEGDLLTYVKSTQKQRDRVIPTQKAITQYSGVLERIAAEKGKDFAEIMEKMQKEIIETAISNEERIKQHRQESKTPKSKKNSKARK